jgi:2-methylcitrate dehydratase PrpD
VTQTDVESRAEQALVEFVAGLRFTDLPGAGVDYATTVVADTCGTLLAGSRSPVTALLAGPATVDTAMRYAMASHETELDDSHASSRTHPATVVIPAVLAAVTGMPADVPDHGGAALLTAVVAGYEVTARLSKAMGVRPIFDRGFHAGPVCGSVGAAAAVGHLLGLPSARMRSAVALAASQACGLVTFERDATHTLKSFHMAAAARNGVTAATLAARGFPAAPAVLGGDGMLRAFSSHVDMAELTAGLGADFEIAHTSLKRHSCCGQTHAALDALLALRAEHGIDPAAVTAVDVELSHDAAAAVDGKALLTHNVQYAAAVALYAGRAGPAQFEPPWTSRPDVHALAGRVSVRGSDRIQAEFPRYKGAVVTVTGSFGSHQRQVRAPRGNPEDPYSREELRAKFAGLAAGAVPAEFVDELWARLLTLPETDDVRPLLTTLHSFVIAPARKTVDSKLQSPPG